MTPRGLSTHLDDPAGYWGEEGWEQQVQDSQEKIGTEDKKKIRMFVSASVKRNTRVGGTNGNIL
jgi:hypothetical protein